MLLHKTSPYGRHKRNKLSEQRWYLYYAKGIPVDGLHDSLEGVLEEADVEEPVKVMWGVCDVHEEAREDQPRQDRKWTKDHSVLL